MSLAAKALWMIERNLGSDLSLAEVADACSVSKFHLIRAFEARTGMPVMQYVRARRLSKAAAALAHGASDILTIALDAGYGSHEAFTRSFRAQFGLTPESVRTLQSVEDLPMTTPPNITETTSSAEGGYFRSVSRGSSMVVGLARQQSLSHTAAIPGQWQEFMQGYYAAIANKTDPIPLSVVSDMDAEGHFQYLCGVEVAKAGEVPAGLIALKVPAQAYVIFTHTAHVSTIGSTYASIWDSWLPKSGQRVSDGPWLERHLPTFNPRTGLGGIEIWIPISA